MDMPGAIRALTEHHDLDAQAMTEVMRTIMSGDATAAQIGGFLIGLRMKGETVEEIAAAAAVMRDFATPVEVAAGEHLVDIVGTGGDGSRTFNISTTSAFVVAAAGGRVAKHGNRSASSTAGSADVLEAAGVALDLSPDQVGQCIEQVGIGFMFAPRHHPAMRHAIGPRREMAVRTLFNLLGPLTNPARAPRQLMGVFADEWVEPLAQVLQRLGSEHVLVAHSSDGLDEISIGAASRIAELRDGRIETYTVKPEDFGLDVSPASALVVNSSEESVTILRSVLDGHPGPALDVTLLNAGAAIYAADCATSIAEGVDKARAVVASGAARRCLDQLVDLSRALSGGA